MIQIKWSEIKRDVQKQTWRIAKTKIADVELRSDAQEDNSKMSATFVMRYAESGIAMVSTAIRESIASSTMAIATDELDMEKEQWTFTMKDGCNVDEKSLAMLIHKFVIEYILFRWCLVWSPNDAGIYEKNYVETLSNITKDVFSMNEPKKNKRPVFGANDEMEVKYEYSEEDAE